MARAPFVLFVLLLGAFRGNLGVVPDAVGDRALILPRCDLRNHVCGKLLVFVDLSEIGLR